MLVCINDMFRIKRLKNQWREHFWQLEGWQPSYDIRGRWQALSPPLEPTRMLELLERRQCPIDALARFKAAM